MGQYSVSFPFDRLEKNADAFRTFDFHVRAEAVAKKIIPEVVASLSSSAPLGQHFRYPNASPSPGGKLKKSFYGITEWSSPGIVTVAFRSKAKYAGFVLRGTKAHDIPVGQKGFLFFYSKQKSSWMKYTKTIHHPGTKPYDYAITARALMRTMVPTEWDAQMRSFPYAAR